MAKDPAVAPQRDLQGPDLEDAAAPAERMITAGDDSEVTISYVVSPLPLSSGWSCDAHGVGRHDVFLSYRVASEGADGNGLVEALFNGLIGVGAPEVGGAQAPPLTCFWDKMCLNLGEAWESGLHNGLEGATLVVPLVSRAALAGMASSASKRRDNLLMEWEAALDRQRKGLCLILPVFVSTHEDEGISFNEESYPSLPHAHSRVDIRATVRVSEMEFC